jgi:peptide/nickel transport system permease protein
MPAPAFGAVVVAVFVCAALFGPLLTPFEANQQLPSEARQAPSARHWFGTDRLGRDVFSRVVVGARDIITLAGFGSALAVVLGMCFGLVGGYFGGLIDEALFRLFDAFLALPSLLIALLLLGTIGPSRDSVLIVIIIVYTPIVARVVRSVVLGLRHKGFVEAARTRGESLAYILLRETLPSVLPALAVEAALRFSYAIFLVASLGFLGVGVQPPSPDWGLMVSENRNYLTLTPWALYFPVAAIALLVIGVNLAADGVRRVLQ